MKMQLSTSLILDSCGFSVGDQPLRSTRQASASFPPLQNYHWCDVGKLPPVEKSPMLGNIFRLSLTDDSSWVYVFSHLKNQPVCRVGKSNFGTPQGDLIFFTRIHQFSKFLPINIAILAPDFVDVSMSSSAWWVDSEGDTNNGGMGDGMMMNMLMPTMLTMMMNTVEWKLHSRITKQRSVGKRSSPQFFSLMPTAAVGFPRPKCALTSQPR